MHDQEAANQDTNTAGLAAGDSVIFNNDIGNDDAASFISSSLLTEGSTFKMWITFDRNTGLLSYGDTSNYDTPLDSHDFDGNDVYNIRHVWVMSCDTADTVTFKICQPIGKPHNRYRTTTLSSFIVVNSIPRCYYTE